MEAQQSFPRTARLLKHADFDRVYQQGKRHFSTHMTVFFLPQAGATAGPRIGLTVGRVLGGAVERNRIKRRLRSALRQQLAAFPDPVDVVINPKKSVLTAGFPELTDEIGRAFAAIRKGAGVPPRPRNQKSR